MKVGFLTSLPDQKCNRCTYKKTVDILQKKGNTVMHTLDISPDNFSKMSSEEKKQVYKDHFGNLRQADIIFADVSCPNIDVMYGISQMVTHLKPVVILYLKGTQENPSIEELFGNNNQQVIVESYTLDTLEAIIADCLNYLDSKVDKRFHILLPAGLMDRLDEVTKVKKIAKAVYIRQVLEMSLL